jgi:hypothetical protein
MITIIQNKKHSFDLFDSKKQVKITNVSFEEIIETKYFFVVRKNNKYGVYDRKGLLLGNGEYSNYEITKKSKSLILTKSNGFIENKILLSKKNKCTDYFFKYHELPLKLEDGSHTFILIFGDNRNHFYQLWNTERGYVFHPCSEVKIISNQTLKCKISDNCLIVDFLGKRISSKRFIEIYGYIGGASLARASEKIGLIDINGEWIEGFDNLIFDNHTYDWGIYANYLERNDNLLPFQKDGLFGLINYNESLIFEPISSCPIIFFKRDKSKALGYAKVTINGLSGIIDDKLNWVIDPVFEDIKDSFIFHNYERYEISYCCIPYIVKSPETNKYGLFSYDGKWIYEPVYDYIKQGVIDGRVSILKDYYLDFELVNPDGKVIVKRNKIPFHKHIFGF